MSESQSPTVRIQLEVDLPLLRTLDKVYKRRYGERRPAGAKDALCVEALARGLASLAEHDTVSPLPLAPIERRMDVDASLDTDPPDDLSMRDLGRLEPDTDEPDGSVDFSIDGELSSVEDVVQGDDQAIVCRTGEYVPGSRQGGDRRAEDRGLDGGRRTDDQRRVRRKFIDRVVDLADEGHPPKHIASTLNDEGSRTARGHRWTTQAIDQLIRTESARRGRKAWIPRALAD